MLIHMQNKNGGHFADILFGKIKAIVLLLQMPWYTPSARTSAAILYKSNVIRNWVIDLWMVFTNLCKTSPQLHLKSIDRLNHISSHMN